MGWSNWHATPFSIQAIQLIPGDSLARQSASTEARGPSVILTIQGPPGRIFQIETGTDLVYWHPVQTTITEPTLGTYEAILPQPATAHAFFRLQPNNPSPSVTDPEPMSPTTPPRVPPGGRVYYER